MTLAVGAAACALGDAGELVGAVAWLLARVWAVSAWYGRKWCNCGAFFRFRPRAGFTPLAWASGA